ncbi:MAG TPA: amino acid adenylation domain-containing protein, partial [Longimicrobium sp.]|nr:amino acid adenylation domain-containing protein [Longimicrobium sp.]
DAERERLLAWGVNDRGMQLDGTPIERFEAQVARTPGAPAVEYHDAAWTYAELDARANRVARRLIALGVRPGDRVGLTTGPSAAMIAALAGVLKTGAAVAPLDPDYPADRLAFMIADAGVRVLVTDGGAPEGLSGEGIAALDLEGDADAIAAEDASPLPAAARGEDTAYVIFTSGSTGRPKAVLTPHRAIVRTFVDDALIAIRPGDRVMQVAALSFDAAVFEVWGALMNGATTVGIDRDVVLSPADFARALRERRITAGFLTSQLFTRHVREIPDIFGTMRCLLVGGEKVDPAAARLCLRSGAPERLLNGYGPTETTVFAVVHPITEVAEDAHTIPIGRPIEATRAYVLDGRGQPCGTGVPGELFIGGGRVAAGYLDRDELTAERFVADPFSPEPGARMYRTGDRVKWRADGTLEFLGRVDWQVKVRGFRIEPGEVEAALREHPAVRECVVIAREDGGERRLVAYAAGPDAAGADLRAFLKARLPDYMIPTAFVALDEIPLNANGKVDRARLPAPESAGAVAEEGYQAPRNRVEQVLAELWAKVLRVERVGIHENFFALGGDSILSIQIIARAAEQGVKVLPRQMFVHQTIAELAEVATSAQAVEAEQGPVTGQVPLAPTQRFFLEQDQPEPHHWNMAILLEPRDALDDAALERAAAAVLDHHDALRMRYSRTVDGWTQTIGEPGEAPAIERIDLSGIDGDARDAAFAAHAARVQGSLDLEHGPIVRFVVFEMGGGRQRLAMAAHHLVVDIISLELVHTDLERAYGQVLRGEPIALPAKTTSYKRWAERMAELARSAEVRAEAAYWLGQGDAAPLPVDFAGGSNREDESATVQVALDAADTTALLQDVPPVYGTQVNDVLLAGLARAFGRWTGEALWLDMEGHGREETFPDVDLARTVGLFTAIYPVRLQVPEEPGEALKTVKEQLRALPRKGMGYGLLRYMGDDETRAALAARRRPDVSFNYLGQLDGVSADDGPFPHAADAHFEPMHSPRANRTHLLSVDASVFGGRLYVVWRCGTKVHQRATVERLAEGYMDALRELVAHCRDPHAGGYTPSDFALSGLDQDDLDALLEQLG